MKISSYLKLLFPIAFILCFLVVSAQAVATVSTTFNYIPTTGDYQVRDVHLFGNSTIGGEHYTHRYERYIWGSTNVIGPTSCSISYYLSNNATLNPECGGDGASGWGSTGFVYRIVTNEVWNLTSDQIFRTYLPQDVNLNQIIIPYSDIKADLLYNTYYDLVNITGATRYVTFITNTTSQPLNQQHTAEARYDLEFESVCQQSGKTYNVTVNARYLFKINNVHVVETYYQDQNVTILNSSTTDFKSRETYNSTLKCTNIEVPDTKNDIPGFDVPIILGSIIVTSYYIIKKKKDLTRNY